MNFDEFKIGDRFWTATGAWKCTDLGSRTVIAIQLNQDDESWYNGPPYVVAEEVFDSFDFPGCRLEPIPHQDDPPWMKWG